MTTPQPQTLGKRAKDTAMAADDMHKSIRELGVTQARFGDALGVNPRAVRKWVGGEVPVPRYAVIILRLMQRFELTLEDIEAAGV